jgi:hypothetical protein
VPVRNRRLLCPAPRLAAILALSAASLCAWAGPPFRTDDPEPVEYKHLEFYVFSQQTLSADGRSGVLPAFELNYGVHDNVQLHLVAPIAFSRPSGQGTTRGYGDTELGVKYRFVQESESVPMVGVFPMRGAHRQLGQGSRHWLYPRLPASLGAEKMG